MGNSESSESVPPPSRAAAPASNGAISEEFFEEYQDPEEGQPKQSYYQMVQQGYNELVKAIIRPPRCEYEYSQLGPMKFEFCGKKFERTDLILLNKRGLKLHCSHWQPMKEFRKNSVLPCVIYMHGNSSSRLEALGQLSIVLSLGATVFSLDFAGSGKSDGEYVSLGCFEKDDLQVVTTHLRESGATSTIALWGRSMGAATALLHGERDPSIAGMILDSPFSSLETLAEEMVDRGRRNGLFAPGFIVSIVISFIRSTIKKKAGFDIKDLAPIKHAESCFIPALFVAGESDDFISPSHSRNIHAQYAGDKNIIIVAGDHNTLRPKFMFDSAAIFLITTLQIPESFMLDPEFKAVPGRLPWQSNRAPHRLSSNNMSLDELLELAHSMQEEMGPERCGPSSADYSAEDLTESLGMTNQLQADVRSKLYTLLGDTSSAVASKVNSKEVKTPPSSLLNGPSSEMISKSSSSSSSSSSLHPSLSSNATVNVTTSGDAGNNGVSYDGWQCELNTRTYILI